MSREYDLVAIGAIARMARVRWTPCTGPGDRSGFRPVAITSAGKLAAGRHPGADQTGRCSSQEEIARESPGLHHLLAVSAAAFGTLAILPALPCGRRGRPNHPVLAFRLQPF